MIHLCRRHNAAKCPMLDCRFERIDEGIEALAALVRTVHEQLNRIEQKENLMSKELDDLAADVAAETSVVQSAVVLINGFAAKLDAAGTDATKLAALSSDVRSSTAALSAAVAANTPAAPPTPVAPEPPPSSTPTP